MFSTEDLEACIASDPEDLSEWQGYSINALARELIAARKVVKAAREDLAMWPVRLTEGCDLHAALSAYDNTTGAGK